MEVQLSEGFPSDHDSLQGGKAGVSPRLQSQLCSLEVQGNSVANGCKSGHIGLAPQLILDPCLEPRLWPKANLAPAKGAGAGVSN